MPFFNIDDSKIYYEVHGSGQPVLMIAGMASDSKSWQFILSQMSKQYQLILFDNRGCGRTETVKSTYDLKDMARDGIALLDFLEYDKVHLIGHSMGGMIAQEMTLMQAERIQKLVLASSSPKLSQKADDILRDLYEKWEDGFDMAEWFRIMFQWLFTREALTNKKFMDAAIIFALAYPYPQSLEGFKGQVEAITRFDAVDRIHRIKNETLILSGGQDILIPPQESRELLNIGGKTTFRIIADAAHSVHAEHPGEFADAVIKFLS